MTEFDVKLEDLVKSVLRSSKYQFVSPDLVRQIGARELAIRKNTKEAIKTTKSKLHQVAGAYFETEIDYEQALSLIREAARTGKEEELKRACRQLMQLHASTKERLEIVDSFYETTLADLPPIQTVLDIACGLNPLALPWMPFDNQVHYLAYDIYGDLIAFINRFLQIIGVDGMATVRNVLTNPPEHPVDLVLLLKTIPCLEQVEKTAAYQLLNTIQANYLLVSYPVRSLGGYGKGMLENYMAQFNILARDRSWQVKRFEFPTELAFMINTT
jgi:16S rRNA (guanine(1405)-N(7))-methyltransferase